MFAILKPVVRSAYSDRSPALRLDIDFNRTPHMPHSIADLASTDPERLLRRLCNHWRHKFEIERRDGQHARIPMGETGESEFTITPGFLHIVARHADAGQLPHLCEVIARHLQRFAPEGEVLVFEWRDEKDIGEG